MNLFRQLFARRQIYDDLTEEIHAHLSEKVEELVAAGMPRKEAEYQARREFGNAVLIEERSREVWMWPTLESILADVKFALRQLRKSPGFTVTAVLTLTLGIGINTAIFSVVHHILLEPLPFPRSSRLQAVWARSDSQGSPRIAASGPDFLDYQDQSTSFSHIVSVLPDFTYTWTGEGEPRLVECTAISEGFFAMLGVRPYLGRFYTPSEYSNLENDTILVSYRFWKHELGSDPHVIGRIIHLQGDAMPIIGVVPPLPDLFPETDVWPEHNTRPSWEFGKWRSNKFLTVIGRLKDGVTPAMAQAELTGILRRAPGEPPDVQVRLTPLKDDLVGSVRTQLRIIMFSVALVLIVACINLAALLLARAARRSGEMALRLSLGAAHKRLRQQLIVEGFVLTLLACSPGIFVAWLALHFLPYVPGLDLPRLDGVHLNGTTLLVTGAVAAATTLFFGWAPSLTFSALNLASSMRTGRTDTGKSHQRSFSGLVIAEIACSVVLSICAGLLLHSYWRLQRVDPGFEPDRMLKAYLRTNYYTPEGRPFWRDVLQGVATLPGVRAAALADCRPGQSAAFATLIFSDRPNDPNHAPPAQGCWMSSNFFRVSGTPLMQGRLFTPGDDADSAPVVIINEQAARKYWPGENPIGKRIAINYTGPGRTNKSSSRMREIVGVVRGMKYGPLELPIAPAVYMPYLQDETSHDMATMRIYVRSVGNPIALESSIRARIHAVAPDQPIDDMQTMQDVVSQSMAPRRYSLSLLGSFAALALLLSAIGIYGIVSYTTLQRTREFGIRIAVGATRGSVMSHIFRRGLALTGTGALLGIGVAVLLTRILSQLLFEVSPLDTLSFAFAVALLAFISVAACLLPAWRASHLDPIRALRTE
ncbi:MAG: ABC transporter permease [Candidatus Sulfotelmatobacter sp.]